MMKKYHIVSIFTLALLSGLQGTIFTFAQSSDANFVLERMMLNSTSTSYADKITYMDGLGRITETIQKGICPSGKDLVSVQEYDFAGRPSKSWLATPYSSGGNYINPSTLISASQAYYGESGSFMLNEYEYSPLARIKKQYGAGNDWQSKGKAIQSEELVNESSGILSCANYSTTSNKSLQKNGIHSAGSLFVAKKTDEDGHIIYTFTDNSAQMLLSRTVVGSVLYDTYYVYDESGQLYYVLPPAASDALTANTTYSLTNQILKDFAYIYRYDNRNRRSEIKKPGCEAVYFKYDKANLLIFSQDGVQRSKSPGEWTFYLYDSFGRNVIKGYCSNSSGSVESAGSILVTCNYTGGSSSFMNSGYTLSNLTLTSAVVEAVYYYDTYDFLNLNPFLGKSQYPLPSVGAKGMQTASVISLTGSSDKISTATYYDLRSRAVKIVSSNHLGGYETENISYTYTGKPLSRTLIHTSQLTSNQTEIYTYTYSSPAERLAQVCHQLNTNSQVVLSDLTYDELGRIKTKKRHGNLETNSYSYNIRDWLTGINGPYFSETLVYNGGTSPLYNGNISSVTWKSGSESVQRGYKFTYDNLGRMLLADYGEESSLSVNTGRFNEQLTYDKQGNIQSLIRRGKQNAGYGVIDNLTYVYSGNKLTKVTDSASDPLFQGAYNFIDGSNSSTEYVYDSNGNVIVDSNKGLCSVVYNRNNLPEHMQFSYGHTISNLYDSKGSKLRSSYVTTNQNLYVPIGSTVTVSSEKVLTSTVRDYCGRIIYENNVLSKILMEEGYITLSGSTPIYHYYEQDNLGNNRVVVNQNGTIEQVTHYYPYGLPFSEGYDNSQQPYKYNGKELDRMHGLDWYDYGARNYDAAIPVWTTVDPLAEKHPDISPYVYCAGNPVNLIDPDGMDWVYHVVDGKTEVYYDRDVKSQDDIVNKYGKDSGVTHMSDGSTLTTYAKDGNVTSEYTFTNENKENKYGTVTDTNGDKLDNTKIKSGSNYTIFGTSDNSVNAETLHKNMFGSSYIGPNNPKDYNRKDSYQYKPTWSPTEMAAYTHDLEYDALGAKGIGGALSPSTKCADMQLIYNCKQVLKNPNSSSNEKSRAKKIIAGFSAINFFKP